MRTLEGASGLQLGVGRGGDKVASRGHLGGRYWTRSRGGSDKTTKMGARNAMEETLLPVLGTIPQNSDAYAPSRNARKQAHGGRFIHQAPEAAVLARAGPSRHAASRASPRLLTSRQPNKGSLNKCRQRNTTPCTLLAPPSPCPSSNHGFSLCAARAYRPHLPTQLEYSHLLPVHRARATLSWW